MLKENNFDILRVYCAVGAFSLVVLVLMKASGTFDIERERFEQCKKQNTELLRLIDEGKLTKAELIKC